MADLLPNVNTAATSPKRAKTDQLEMEAVAIPDLIAADRYQKAAAAQGTPTRGVMFGKFIPAGPSPDQQGTGNSSGNFDTPGGF